MKAKVGGKEKSFIERIGNIHQRNLTIPKNITSWC
jgi:hypothetical protein